MGKPRRHMCKALHCDSKQQQSSHAMISDDSIIIACSYHIYVVLFFTHIPFMVNHKSTQCQRRGCNTSVHWSVAAQFTFMRLWSTEFVLSPSDSQQAQWLGGYAFHVPSISHADGIQEFLFVHCMNEWHHFKIMKMSEWQRHHFITAECGNHQLKARLDQIQFMHDRWVQQKEIFITSTADKKKNNRAKCATRSNNKKCNKEEI